MIKRIISSLPLLLLLLSRVCWATEYYISPNGNDNWVGDYTHPFKTIQKGANSADPGDVVNVLSGIYYESIRVDHGGVEGMPIIFKVPTGEDVTIKAAVDFCFLVPDSTVQYVIFEGFKLTEAWPCTTNHGAGIRILGSYCIVRYNFAYNNDMGVFIETFNPDSLTCNSHNQIIGNVISNSGEAGIRIKRSDNTTVINNLLYHNSYTHDVCGALTYYGTDSTIILNNTLWDNAGVAIHNYNGTNQYITPVSTNCLVANNICVRLDGKAVFKIDSNMIDEPSNEYSHNIWYNGEPGSKIIAWGYDNVNIGGMEITLAQFQEFADTLNPNNGIDCLDIDPQFSDPQNLVFDLLPNSPAIDLGMMSLQEIGLVNLTDLSSQIPDSDPPDLGYHHTPGIYEVNPPVYFNAQINIFPNPTNDVVRFDLQLPASNSPSIPTLNIYNVLGQKVASLSAGYDNPNNHFVINWSPGQEISSGLYFVIMKSQNVQHESKVIILK